VSDRGPSLGAGHFKPIQNRTTRTDSRRPVVSGQVRVVAGEPLAYDLDSMEPITFDRPPRRSQTQRTRWVRTLAAIVDRAELDDVVLKDDLQCGDRVVVTTRNSVYSLLAVGGNSFVVSGGWFDRRGAPVEVTVNGCTYGGSVIRHDVVAGRGLFLEFGNNVLTTRIRSFEVVRGPDGSGSTGPSLPC
jgi:hypothetical protein